MTNWIDHEPSTQEFVFFKGNKHNSNESLQTRKTENQIEMEKKFVEINKEKKNQRKRYIHFIPFRNNVSRTLDQWQ